MRCALCECEESRPCPDSRTPTGRCFFLAKGSRPICSKHFTTLPEQAIPQDHVAPEVEGGPVLQIFDENDMRTVVALHDEERRRLQDRKRRIF